MRFIMPDAMIPATDTAAHFEARMPAEVARAIAEVMGQIKSLPKGATNSHAGYNFASIDNFLSVVGPLCAAAGLIVLQDEDTVDLIDRAGKAWLRITYSFQLAHSSGAIWERTMRRTDFQRIDGPQTTGGTQSYALKQFLRSLFQIPTGDRDDADFTPKEDMPAQTRQPVQDAPRPKAAPASASEAKANPDASGEAAQDKDRIILGGIVADLRRARTAHGRDEILMERGQRVSEILARRPDLQVRWLTALDEINKRHLLAAAE
jgi:hypothetical protein